MATEAPQMIKPVDSSDLKIKSSLKDKFFGFFSGFSTVTIIIIVIVCIIGIGLLIYFLTKKKSGSSSSGGNSSSGGSSSIFSIFSSPTQAEVAAAETEKICTGGQVRYSECSSPICIDPCPDGFGFDCETLSCKCPTDKIDCNGICCYPGSCQTLTDGTKKCCATSCGVGADATCCSVGETCVNGKCIVKCGPVDCPSNSKCVVVKGLTQAKIEEIEKAVPNTKGQDGELFTCQVKKNYTFSNPVTAPAIRDNFYPAFVVGENFDTTNGAGFCTSNGSNTEKQKCYKESTTQAGCEQAGCKWYDVMENVLNSSDPALNDVSEEFNKVFNDKFGSYCRMSSAAGYFRAVKTLCSGDGCDYVSCIGEMSDNGVTNVLYDANRKICVGLQNAGVSAANGISSSVVSQNDFPGQLPTRQNSGTCPVTAFICELDTCKIIPVPKPKKYTVTGFNYKYTCTEVNEEFGTPNTTYDSMDECFKKGILGENKNNLCRPGFDLKTVIDLTRDKTLIGCFLNGIKTIKSVHVNNDGKYTFDNRTVPQIGKPGPNGIGRYVSIFKGWGDRKYACAGFKCGNQDEEFKVSGQETFTHYVPRTNIVNYDFNSIAWITPSTQFTDKCEPTDNDFPSKCFWIGDGKGTHADQRISLGVANGETYYIKNDDGSFNKYDVKRNKFLPIGYTIAAWKVHTPTNSLHSQLYSRIPRRINGITVAVSPDRQYTYDGNKVEKQKRTDGEDSTAIFIDNVLINDKATFFPGTNYEFV